MYNVYMQRGFTLIELLMSIALIAILSTFALGGLDTARGRSNDAKTKSQLNGLRTAAQSYNTTYGDFSSAANCTEGMFSSTEFSMSAYSNQANYPASTVLKCNANLSNYAVSANLTGDGGYWCVDASGSRRLSEDPGEVVICP